MKKLLWRAMLDSDFNERYWRAMSQKFYKHDLRLKLFLAVSTSGTVAGWTVWSEYPVF